MKILIVGGMHGNEPLGISLVKIFQKKTIRNIDAILANEKAIKENRRFIKKDLNRSFPGDINSKNYEEKRAAEILEACKRYDLVLDFHNTYCPNNDCTFLGESASEFLFDVSCWLGFKKVIVADYDCINKYAVNCLSMEVSLRNKLMNTKTWYEKILRLANMQSLPKARGVKRYKFVYRITLEDRDRLNLKEKKLKAFKPLSKNLASYMGVKSPAYPIFIKDKFTPYNYGGLLNKI